MDDEFGALSTRWQCSIYHFKDRRVEIRHYSIRSQFKSGVGARHPKSWVTERSDNYKNWTEFDPQSNNSELNDQNQMYTWVMKRGMKNRYIQLSLTRLNHYDDHTLWLSSFEFFGSLIEESDK
jgi:hypothetical protein